MALYEMNFIGKVPTHDTLLDFCGPRHCPNWIYKGLFQIRMKIKTSVQFFL
jgi:hypothetical protein